MEHIQILVIGKLTGRGIVKVAARHNLREIPAELGAGGRIDPSRIHLNCVLRGPGTAGAVAAQADALIASAGLKKLRKDAVHALEVMVSLPPASGIDEIMFFEDAIVWAENYFCAPLLSAVVHHDEAAPHCHVLVLPLLKGHMVGSDMHGGGKKLEEMQTNFHEQVGQRYGLIRQTPQKRLSAAIRQQAVELAFGVLEANSGLDSEVLRVLLKPHLKNPEPLLRALGLSVPTPAVVKGGFVKMMTKPCKPESHKSTNIADPGQQEKGKPYCSVWFASSALPVSPATPSSSSTSNTRIPPTGLGIDGADRPGDADNTEQTELDLPADAAVETRERDDFLASEWNPITGEPIRRLPKPASGKSQVTAEVRAVLASRQGGADLAGQDAVLRWAG